MALLETQHAGGAIVSELPDLMSRKTATLNSGQNLLANTIVAQLLVAGAATGVGTPTGTGTITVGAIGSAAVIGVYKLVCVAAATNAGTFNFYAPNGNLIRQITVGGGAAANDHIVITIADATDFIVGDTFTITVTGGDYEALDPAEDDGAQIASGMLFADTDATSADKPCVVLYRDAVFNADEIIWPTGISDANKATAISQLAARGITLR